jgi:hypothetical protein
MAKRRGTPATPPHPADTRPVVTTAVPDGTPGWLAPVVYALACMVLFRETVFTGASLLGMDSLALSYFARNFYTEFVQALHRFPQWNPLLFGGLPFIDGMHGDIFYPPSLALFWLDARAMWGWKMVLHFFLAGCFTYLWLRSIALRRGPALVGGLIYLMGPQIVSLTLPGGDGKLFVSALAPLVFWLAERAAQRRLLADFAFFGLGITAIVFTSHMQLAYFCIWGVSLYFMFRVWQIWKAEQRSGTVARLVGLYTLAGLLGVAAAAVQFFPPLGYLREWSHRTDRTVQAHPAEAFAYSTSWSLHWEEAVSLVVPEFVGDNAQTETRSGETYWGRNPAKLNSEYAGFVPLVLALLLFFGRREPRAWFFAGLALLSVVYALGANTPLFRLFYMIPGVSLFRAPSLIIFLYALSVATLGALGLQRLIDAGAPVFGSRARHVPIVESSTVRRALWGVTAVFGVLALLAAAGVVTSVWLTMMRSDISPAQLAALQENMPSLQAGFWITAVLAALVAGVWEAYERAWIGARAVLVLIALVAALDLYRAGRPFVRSTVQLNEYADPVLFQPDESIRFLQQVRASNAEPFRVFDLGAYRSNILAVHGLEQLAGHHGNEIGRYRELIGGEAAANVMRSDLRLLDLLNVVFVTSPRHFAAEGLEEVFVGSRSAVYRNVHSGPRAFLADRIAAGGDTNAVERMLAPGFDPREVLLADPLPDGWTPEAGATGTVEWTHRGEDELRLEVTATGRALLVIMDNYYPAWHAEVGGRDVPILRAHHTFRAVPIDAGTHTVRLYYGSDTVRTSALVSAALLLLLTGVGVAGSVRAARPARTEPADEAQPAA